jgi:hypothetical protein
MPLPSNVGRWVHVCITMKWTVDASYCTSLRVLTGFKYVYDVAKNEIRIFQTSQS